MNTQKWDRRIARARELAETYPFAKEILLFYSQLTNFQKGSYLQYLSDPSATRAGSTRGSATGVPPVHRHGQDAHGTNAHGTSREGGQHPPLPAALDDID